MDYTPFQKALLEEKAQLEEQMKHLGTPTGRPGDWDATLGDQTREQTPDETSPESDPLDAATHIEEYEERVSVQGNLEKRYQEVTAAMKALEDKTYGTCTTGGDAHPIEEGRLRANPAALTCTVHA